MRGEREGRLFAIPLKHYLFGLNVDEGGIADVLAEGAVIGLLRLHVLNDGGATGCGQNSANEPINRRCRLSSECTSISQRAVANPDWFVVVRFIARLYLKKWTHPSARPPNAYIPRHLMPRMPRHSRRITREKLMTRETRS